jgi:phage shock protein PspC (stress-responsive transcriptional regulator)
MIQLLKSELERNAFGVCAWLGDKTGISAGSVRLFFIYTSFLTVGSPVILYMILAFWLDWNKHSRKGRSTIWDI